VYAPIAYRRGIRAFNSELEHGALLYLEGREYALVSREVDRNLKGSEKIIEHLRADLESRLKEAGISGEVTGRRKHYHSIWSKMRRRGVDLAQLYDVLAFRVVVGETRDCYAV